MLTAPDTEALAQLESQRTAILKRLGAVREQQEAIAQIAQQLEREREATQESLHRLDRALGRVTSPGTPCQLSGRPLRDAAIEVLQQELAPGEAIHYQRWIELLRDHGITVGGKNPSATLLTQISNAPEVESVRRRSGLFRLRYA